MSRVLLPAVVTAVLLLAGCGEDASPRAERDEPAPAPARTRTAAQPPTSGPTGSTTPAPTTPSGAPPPSAPSGGSGKIAPPLAALGRPDGSRSHLLDETGMPRLGAALTWQVDSTGTESVRPVGACQKTPLTDLGALHAVRRVLSGPEGSGVRAQQVVGRFADPKSAWRAGEVLSAWRDDCEQRLDYPTSDVGPLRPVAVVTGTGAGYRAAYGPRKRPAATGLGIARKGRWLSVVEVRASAGAEIETPPRRAVRRAVRRVAATFA